MTTTTVTDTLAALEERATAAKSALAEVHTALAERPADPALHAKAEALEAEIASAEAQQKRLATAKTAHDAAEDLKRREARLALLNAARERILEQGERQAELVRELIALFTDRIAPVLAELTAISTDRAADASAIAAAPKSDRQADAIIAARDGATLRGAVGSHVLQAVYASGLGREWLDFGPHLVVHPWQASGSVTDAIDAANEKLFARLDAALHDAAADLGLAEPRPKPPRGSFRRPKAPEIDFHAAAMAAAGMHVKQPGFDLRGVDLRDLRTPEPQKIAEKDLLVAGRRKVK